MFTGSIRRRIRARQAAAPAPRRAPARPGAKRAKKPRAENLDPTLRLDLLASSEQTQYEGSGRNIFVSRGGRVVIPKPGAPGVTDAQKARILHIHLPMPPPPPIPLKFYGFASRPESRRKFS